MNRAPPTLRSRAAGFTMLELLVSLAILTFAFVIVHTTFSSTLKAWRRGGEMLDQLHHGDFVMEQLVGALRSTAYFTSVPGKYGFRQKDRGGGTEPEDLISWVTSSAAFLPPASPLVNGLHRLTVEIGDVKGGDRGFVVRAYPQLAEMDDNDAEPWLVSSEVQGLDCEYYDFEEEDWREEWEDTNNIPNLLRVTLYMKPQQEFDEPLKLQRLVEVPIAPQIPGKVRPDEGQPPTGEGTPAQGGQPAQESGAPAEGSGEGNPPPKKEGAAEAAPK